MGKYAQLANAADCKSVTLAVNIAGSIPALPTNMVASSKRSGHKTFNLVMWVRAPLRSSYAGSAEAEYALG